MDLYLKMDLSSGHKATVSPGAVRGGLLSESPLIEMGASLKIICVVVGSCREVVWRFGGFDKLCLVAIGLCFDACWFPIRVR